MVLVLSLRMLRMPDMRVVGVGAGITVVVGVCIGVDAGVGVFAVHVSVSCVVSVDGIVHRGCTGAVVMSSDAVGVARCGVGVVVCAVTDGICGIAVNYGCVDVASGSGIAGRCGVRWYMCVARCGVVCVDVYGGAL